MSLHKQQAARASSPAVPGSPYSPSLSRQQSNHSGGQSRQHPLSPFGLPQQQSTPHPLSQQLPQQQPLHQPGKAQQQAPAGTARQSQLQGQGSGQASQQTLISPLNPKFQLLPEAERLKVLRQYLLAQKPSLQPLEVPQPQPHTSHEVSYGNSSCVSDTVSTDSVVEAYIVNMHAVMDAACFSLTCLAVSLRLM